MVPPFSSNDASSYAAELPAAVAVSRAVSAVPASIMASNDCSS